MSDPNIDVLARTIFGEARGEGGIGMKAVACVVLNRCRKAQAYMQEHGKAHPEFGNGSPESCCKAKWQFSCWNAADPNCKVINDVDDSDPIFAQAIQIATSAVNGLLDDTTNDATFYYAKSIETPPSWAEGKEPCAFIGGQLFFNNIP